jgi:hypothetical protein
MLRFSLGTIDRCVDRQTTLAELLALTLNEGSGGKAERCAVLGMDGYHYANSHLEAAMLRDPDSGLEVRVKTQQRRKVPLAGG